MKLSSRITLVFIAALLSLNVLTVSTFAASVDNDVIDDWDIEYTLGDIDKNGTVNTDDLLALRKYIAGLVTEGEILLVAADINNDEAVNTDDLIELRKILAGLI